MRRYLKPLLMLMVISFLSVACMQAQEQGAKKLDLAPDFKLLDLNNNTITLSAYRDKQPVLLFFWTTWCPFCRKELKTLNDRYPQLVKEGWELLSIDVGEPAYKVDNAIKRYSLNFKVLLDKDTTVAGSYNILGVPTYVIINKKGHVVFKDHYFPQDTYKYLILK
jgi:peroxiredoxin